MEDVLLTVAEVAKLLKINTTMVYKLLDSKELPFIKLGAKKVRKAALIEFLEKNEGNDLTDPFDVKKIGE